MNLRVPASLICLALLAGCVTATPDNLLSTEPQGAAQKAGNYPVFGRVPVAQTNQLTPTEKAEIQAELARNKQVAERRSSPNSQTDYIAEVNRLKKLAQDRIDSLTDRIESESEAASASDG